MKTSVLSLMAAAVALLLPVASHAQAPSHPSLEGTWLISTPTPSLLPKVGKSVPFTSAGRKLYEANLAAAKSGNADFDLSATRCSSPGLPRLMLTEKRFHIFDRSDVVTFMFEWNRLFRQIDLRQKKYDTEIDSGQKEIGSSTAKWVGDTLVVKSDNFTDTRLLDNYLPSSDEMVLEENFRLLDPETLQDEITITDQKYYSKPIKYLLTYKRATDDLFPEDICLNRLKAGQAGLPR